jgi:uncharacterized Zn finger protein (UPF0148 family)
MNKLCGSGCHQKNGKLCTICDRTQYVIKTTDEEKAKELMKSANYASFIFELRHNFWRKYENMELTDEQAEIVDMIRNEVYELLNDCEV